MEKTFDFLKNRTNVQFVATVDGDRPSLRPFGSIMKYDGKIYVMTNARKNVAKQLAANNHVCMVALDGGEWIRVNCELVDDSDNIEAKKAVLAEFDWAAGLGYSLESPDFKVFYLANVDSNIYDAAGNVLVHEQF